MSNPGKNLLIHNNHSISCMLFSNVYASRINFRNSFKYSELAGELFVDSGNVVTAPHKLVGEYRKFLDQLTPSSF
ncbi:MAG: hypothetical protein A2161_08820 [Candidatus Schekmanbacteria bacterium RBG_13_48_7]|uniref:Uncharacterized protein n=1 Tax=Candidatus Schekmanbacteria bacterium RBG_13_48_7 TaxID=1817878 RepID=A0A1F7S6T0_9BACT|nr:MAG: hypothetical protein A2161_08820 [Candidatus Schekmanbacteria bacterium RBG_13_48_7]